MKPCPDGFTAGYYWYGSKRRGPGRPPQWVQEVLSSDSSHPDTGVNTGPRPSAEVADDVPGPDAGQSEPEQTADDPTNNVDEEIADTPSNTASVDPNDEANEGADDEGEQENPRMPNNDSSRPRRYLLRRASRPPERRA